MVHAGCVFVASIHPSRTWMSGSFESLQWNACVHRLNLSLCSHPKEFFGEWSQNPCGCKWRHKHPWYNKADPYYLLTRREQVTVFRLRTGHNRLNYHLYSNLRIGHTEQCPCNTGSQTTEHLLQSCPTYEPLRKGIWPDHTPKARKLYGSLRDLRCTATFIGETGVSIWRTRRRRTHANCQGKISSTEKKFSPEEDQTHAAASSRTVSPTHYQWAIAAPC